MNTVSNNLFSYATSELSQDAFICWLMSHATEEYDNKPNKDVALQACAKDFIKEFLELDGKNDYVITKIERQTNHIDVLLTVLVNKKDIYKIIVEDKIKTNEHNNQLSVYKKKIEEIEKDKRDNNDPDAVKDDDHIIGIYFKTDFQKADEYKNDKKYIQYTTEDSRTFCFRFLDLKDIYNVINKHITKTSNHIFNEFYEYWSDQYNESEKCIIESSLSLEHIKRIGISGFYNDFYQSDFHDIISKNPHLFNFEKSGFGYVNNSSGGFLGMWFFANTEIPYKNGITYIPYIQIEIQLLEVVEKVKICFKIELSENKQGTTYAKDAKDLRNLLTDGLDTQYKKPDRYSTGKTMTLGIYNKDDMTPSQNCEYLRDQIKDALNDFSNIVDYCKKKT